MQSKQKLSDDEKTTLINFYKENKAFWSSEVNFRNKEEKSAVKEHFLKESIQRDFLIKTFMLSAQLFQENIRSIKEIFQRKSGNFTISCPF